MAGESVLIGKGAHECRWLLERANRHGLVAGATGTGKTVTLQVLAEGFSRAGVPVFVADVKGDLAGLARPGEPDEGLAERARMCGDDAWAPAGVPVVFWDVFGEAGHPVRTTIAEMGPVLLGRLLDLNNVQEGVMTIAFAVADDEGLLLLDLDDLRALLAFLAEHRKELQPVYGNVSPASVGAIQRRLLSLEREGGALLFGEPAVALDALMQTDAEGRGYVSVLAANRLVRTRQLYATFLLWLLAELFEELPEVGDPEKPRLVFFFDEAHLLFDGAPKALLDKIEQVVRLIRSKGVGVYFVTQSPSDVPTDVLGQLGSRIQHALRAFTPKDQKAVKSAAETFRPNPAFDTKEAITELAVGEALVSTLDAEGVPSIVDRAKVRPPASRMGPLTTGERADVLAGSPVAGAYEMRIDRHSAKEMLAARALRKAAAAPLSEPRPRGRRSGGYSEAAVKSALRSLGTQLGRSLGRELARGLFGGLSRR